MLTVCLGCNGGLLTAYEKNSLPLPEMRRVLWVKAVDFNAASFGLGIMIRCHHSALGSNGSEAAEYQVLEKGTIARPKKSR